MRFCRPGRHWQSAPLRGKVNSWGRGRYWKKAVEKMGATVTTLSETDAKAWRSIVGQVTAYRLRKETRLWPSLTQVWAQLNEAKKAV